jgi:hypothetical protein
MDIFSQFVASGALVTIAKIVYVAIVLFAPFALGKEFFHKWTKYVRAKWESGQKKIVLELQIPKGEAKSPLAMELFITALHQTSGEGTWYDKYVLGKTRGWFSLELVSFEGSIHFFICTRERWKMWIESQLYAQFPDIEIRTVDDYVKKVNFNLDEYDMFAADYVKANASHLPIKTYTSFGLEKDPEEEFKVDPITPLLEHLASLGRGEQFWLQIGVRAHKKEIKKPDAWFEKVDWKHAGEADIKKLMKRDEKPKEGEVVIKDLSMTKGEKEKVEAIERSLSKLAFDTVIRGVYIGKKENFNGATGGTFAGLMRPFNTAHLNSFKPVNTVDFDYPWQDYNKFKESKNKLNHFKVYKERQFFFPDYFPSQNYFIIPSKYKVEPFVMTTEELATIYHFPGDVARTPSLSRVVAKKAEPPANLPI